MIEVEICTPSLASARAAKKGGATRIELCHDLACGGLTPTMDEVEECVHQLGLRTHVLIRPRPGNFCYNAEEVGAIMQCIEQCRMIGAHAVVVGFLTLEGKIDCELTRNAVEVAGKMEVTFHRAFDEAHQDAIEALHAVASCGCTRLLTSGQRPTAIEGASVIKQLVGASSVKILAGSGVTHENVRQLIDATGVSEVHGSCKKILPNGSYETDAELVRQLIRNTEI